MRPKVLIAASSKTRAKTLAKTLADLKRGVEIIVGDERPKQWDSFRLLVCELGPKLTSIEPLLDELPSKAHVILLLTRFAVKDLPIYMRDPRVNHLLRKPSDQRQLHELLLIADKLATGKIFGVERYLPESCDVIHRRLTTFAERCNAIDEMVAYATSKRLRGSIRRACGTVAEELLMNAMYHAPVDHKGEPIFGHITPAARVRRRTPQPVSMRYAAYNKVLYLSVRDRFGSFRREKLIQSLHRCTTQEVQIENKKLGAGLGLYVIVSAVPRMIINLLPGGVTEVICIFEPPPQPPGLRLFSFTAQRPLVAEPVDEENAEADGRKPAGDKPGSNGNDDGAKAPNGEGRPKSALPKEEELLVVDDDEETEVDSRAGT